MLLISQSIPNYKYVTTYYLANHWAVGNFKLLLPIQCRRLGAATFKLGN